MVSLISRLRRTGKTESRKRVTLTLSADREIGVPFDVRISFESVARSALPPVLAFDLIETIIDESGGSTSSRVGVRASFIAQLSTGLRESAYETQAVTPLGGNASGGPKGGVRYEWAIELGHNANASMYWFEIEIGPAAVNRSEAEKGTNGTAALDFAANYGRAQQGEREAGTTMTSLIAPSDCTITRDGREWRASFAPRGVHSGVGFCAVVAIVMLISGLYPLVKNTELDSRALVEACFFGALAVALGAVAFHFAARIFHVTIAPAGLTVSHGSPLSEHTTSVPLARLSHLAAYAKYLSGRSDGRAIRACEAGKEQAIHAVTPGHDTPGTIDALLIEMNAALADVRHYGITPAPTAAQPLFGRRQRVMARIVIAAVLACLWAITYALWR